MRSNGGRKLGSPGRRTPDSADSAFCVRGQLALEPPCLPGKRYAVLQESSAPRADEHAIWDTLRSRGNSGTDGTFPGFRGKNQVNVPSVLVFPTLDVGPSAG